jgi:hypothetical protein
VSAAVPPALTRSRPVQTNGRLGKLSRGLGSRFGGGPAARKGRREGLDVVVRGQQAERLETGIEWPARASWSASPYVGVAHRTSHERTGGCTRAADHGTWRANFDAPRCGCGLGRSGASGRRGLETRGLGMRPVGSDVEGVTRSWRASGTTRRGARATSRRARSHSGVCLFRFTLV